MKTISKNHIVSELIRIDVKPGMELEVHSSLKSFSFVDLGAETVIDALKDVVGANGSIFMPALRLSQDLPLSEEDKKNGLLRKIKFCLQRKSIQLWELLLIHFAYYQIHR